MDDPLQFGLPDSEDEDEKFLSATTQTEKFTLELPEFCSNHGSKINLTSESEFQVLSNLLQSKRALWTYKTEITKALSSYNIVGSSDDSQQPDFVKNRLNELFSKIKNLTVERDNSVLKYVNLDAQILTLKKTANDGARALEKLQSKYESLTKQYESLNENHIKEKAQSKIVGKQLVDVTSKFDKASSYIKDLQSKYTSLNWKCFRKLRLRKKYVKFLY